ncbi:MAG: protein translocase subunit SecD [Thermodesulfobacteriota bacterium]|nr:protein translocase subunit SecD [Thermodesulfobacteriota bacterium]MEE2975338.1 protein translocase subunit SecD [Thermodesulfobacteriota bacterium]|tara:strand:- start:289 stop:1878 length:1590 start_codon:yes stop_codon:yes gene_type:complete
MSRLKIFRILSLVVFLLSLAFIYPTFNFNKLPNWWRFVFPEKKINLGLDLRGGVFVVMGLDEGSSESIISSKEEQRIKDSILDKNILLRSTMSNRNEIQINFYDKKSAKSAYDILSKKSSYLINQSDNIVKIKLSDEFIADTKKKLLQQVKDILSNRIDQFGVVESSVQLSGSDRIAIQIPGVDSKQRERILGIISKTAMLEFKPVIEQSPSREFLISKYKLKDNKDSFKIYEIQDYLSKEKEFIVTKSSSPLRGSTIVDASVAYDEFNRAYVAFKLNSEGTRIFSQLTKENIGNKIAIVLDDKVKSSPIVQDQIFSRGSITGNFSFEQANDLAIILKSGSLPIPVSIMQEKTIGPSLGSDSISKGKTSMIFAAFFIFIFILLYYRRLGVVCNLALIFNFICIFGLLSVFGVTLTFPGIAGLVLTLGMAVDGNIIIYERIKEELSKGKEKAASIEAGFEKSLSTILDANFTTLIASICMFLLGDGPIKGFAVTLSIGIFSTIFSNIVFTRVLTKSLINPESLSGGKNEV